MYAGTSPHLRFGPPRCTFPPTFRSPNLAIFTKICHIIEPQIWQNLKKGKKWPNAGPQNRGGTPPFLAKMGGVPPPKIPDFGGGPPRIFRGGTPPKNPKKGSKNRQKSSKMAKKGPKMAKNGQKWGFLGGKKGPKMAKNRHFPKIGSKRLLGCTNNAYPVVRAINCGIFKKGIFAFNSQKNNRFSGPGNNSDGLMKY